jgi:hypothetical protein
MMPEQNHISGRYKIDPIFHGYRRGWILTPGIHKLSFNQSTIKVIP